MGETAVAYLCIWCFLFLEDVMVEWIARLLTDIGESGSSPHVAYEVFANDIPWVNITNILITSYVEQLDIIFMRYV